MRISLILFLFWIYLSNGEITKDIEKCIYSPLSMFFHKPSNPPYYYVNFKRPQSFWNVFQTEIVIGDPDDYQSTKLIGEGIAAQVYQGFHKETKTPIVLKNMKQQPEKILKEIKILQELKDAPNFLPLKDIYVNYQRQESLTLVFDYFPHTPIQQILPILTKRHIKQYGYKLLKTLDYIHSRGIIHRDIKPLNILLNEKNFELRVIDVGQGEFFLPGKDNTVRIGSLFYKAPELLLNMTRHDYSVDIWSVGVMLAEMMFQKFHFFTANKVYQKQNNVSVAQVKEMQFREQLDAIAQIMGTVPLLQYTDKFKDTMNLDILQYVGQYKKVRFKAFVNENNRHLMDPLGIDLLEKMIVYDHTKRLTAKEAMNHVYFDDVRN